MTNIVIIIYHVLEQTKLSNCTGKGKIEPQHILLDNTVSTIQGVIVRVISKSDECEA